jgi:hypothetical protein
LVVKKLAIALFFVFALYALSYAHPPSEIDISYDPVTRILTAIITHNVNDPQAHYIKKVDIGLNGQEIIGQEISRQDNDITQTVSYRIPDARPGDILSVEAYCSISGMLKREIRA